ncbi:hypothetical protein HELRODRAFT_158828 [Helobdella robusta]|uniref:Uncharacterized protein n=1 Tax=Helobdella robusta TaxID=6412 RepID=T1ENB2_HELRO|nr:hypothetical protein HELRODRAFT_158828 [Helobdella robusta]ESO12330.1 hypothetical protein HELRODRAFT_158828 [Helobdella robusta]
MNFANRRVLRSALNFVSDGEVVRKGDREFQRKWPEKAKADLAKECLTRVKKKWVLSMVLRSALNFASDGEVVREVASAREQDMEIYEKRKRHEQLDKQQSYKLYVKDRV